MKRTLSLLVVLALAFGFFNSAPADINLFDAKVAMIEFDTEIINYGTIEQHSDGTKIFAFTNTGDAPLIINEVKTSCGCTVPRYSKAPILPGESGELEIKYNTKKLGAFTKTITVKSNAEGGNKILKIKGTVVAAK